MNFSFDIFKDIPFTGHMYFFYGLAFFFLGISVFFTQKRSRELIITSSFWLLAAFGITHGIYAWLELFLLLQEPHITQSEFYLFQGLTVLILITSFLLLSQFGLVLIFYSIKNRRRKLIPAAVFVLLFSFWALSLSSQLAFTDHDFLTIAYRSTRHTFGLFGSLLTAYGLWLYSHNIKSVSRPVTKHFLYTGIVFVFYGIAAGIVPSHSLLPFVHIPIEVVRALCIVLITYFILNAVNLFEMETKRNLEKQVLRFEQSEKLISIGRLAAGIAHEINNPLANASLNVEILRNRLKNINNPEILTRLDNMEKHIGKASTIAKELLQFSRDAESYMVPVDINSIINSSLTLMEHKLKGMRVRTNLADAPNMTGDPIKLEQVMMNILDNAQHAMNDGDEIRIESSFHDGSIEITVTDSGTGISGNDLPNVFDPFFTTKDIGVGTGLGLSICYGIIDQHKGEINIESKEGQGTTVTLTLPAGRPHKS